MSIFEPLLFSTFLLFCFTRAYIRKMDKYYHLMYIINLKNRILHGRLEIRNFSSRIEKYFTRSLRSLVKYLFNTRREISYLRAAM